LMSRPRSRRRAGSRASCEYWAMEAQHLRRQWGSKPFRHQLGARLSGKAIRPGRTYGRTFITGRQSRKRRRVRRSLQHGRAWSITCWARPPSAIVRLIGTAIAVWKP
jgi:hypothetical protein